jgi:hypothetical protein
LYEPEWVYKNEAHSRGKIRQQQRFARDRRGRVSERGQLSQFRLVGWEETGVVGKHGGKKKAREDEGNEGVKRHKNRKNEKL